MNTVRLVLQVPFMRYPAGTVFELSENTEPDGWDDDERVRDRQNFSDRRVYALPDGGRGYAVQLHASDTKPCPVGVFDSMDIRTGPCRVTKVVSGKGEDLTDEGLEPGMLLREESVELTDSASSRLQGIRIPLPAPANQVISLTLFDVLRNQELPESKTAGDTPLELDFSDLPPGFYRLMIRCRGDIYHSVRFIKSFPLLVMFTGGGRFTTQQTLY